MKRTIWPVPLKWRAQLSDGLVVDAALDDAVDLDPVEAGGFGGANAFEHRLDADFASVHALEDGVIKAVEADGDAVEPGLAQRAGVARQEVAVGGEGRVFDAFDPGEQADQGGHVGAQEGFAAGEAQLAYAQVDEEPGETLDLLEGEELRLRQKGVARAENLGGHAVGTAEIAAVGDGNAQVAHFASARVGDCGEDGRGVHGWGWRGGGLALLESTWGGGRWLVAWRRARPCWAVKG